MFQKNNRRRITYLNHPVMLLGDLPFSSIFSGQMHCRLQGDVHSTVSGHKELSSTMVYARAHDQTVAEDYFAAMERVEQRLDIVPKKEEDTCAARTSDASTGEQSRGMGDVKVRALLDQLAQPRVWVEERLSIVGRLREVVENKS